MIRKFNYTGRKRIPVECIQVNLIRERGKTYFDASVVNLERIGISPDARLVLEAFDRGSYQRFDWGTVGHPIAPRPEERQLSEIQEAEMVHFRLRAIDDSGSIGRILATTKDMRVWAEEVEEARKGSLLSVVRRNIGDSIWEINFEVGDDDPLELEISERFDEVLIKELLRSDAYFTSLIYPSVLNTILTQIILVDETRDSDGDGWGNKWLYFTLKLPGVDPLPDDPNAARDTEWIKEAVRKYCRYFSLADNLVSQIQSL